VEAEPAERRLRTHLEPSPVVTSEPTPERHRERPPKGKKPATPDRPILVTPPPVEAEPPDPPPRGYEIDYGL
jgi:hypothetical protein